MISSTTTLSLLKYSPGVVRGVAVITVGKYNVAYAVVTVACLKKGEGFGGRQNLTRGEIRGDGDGDWSIKSGITWKKPFMSDRQKELAVTWWMQ